MTIRHQQGTYEIDFRDARAFLAGLPSDTFVMTDQTVGALLPTTVPTLRLPPGETTKSLIWLEAACTWLSANMAGRKSVVVALGGGVVGDLVGLVAATYMRGVDYIQVPTTLLAQVDSSVGGKVAVDLPVGKNLVGAFYPPRRVVIDTDLLKTLSPRQRRNGMAEVLKYGFIMDPPLLDLAELDEIVPRCVAHKAAIVEADEFETNGIRATLNFGHTIGHAIEQITAYREFLHGEAVSIGMALEARLGEELGFTERGTSEIVRGRLEREGLPTAWKVRNHVDDLLATMKRDKKADQGRIRMSLLCKIGECKLVDDVPEAVVARLLSE